MLVTWLAYALLVSLLIALGVRGIEGALSRLGRATRWAWAAGLVLVPLLVLAPFLGEPQPATSGEGTAAFGVQLGAIEVVQGMGSRAVEGVPGVASALGEEGMARLAGFGLALWFALSALLLLRVGMGFRDLRSARRRWPRVRLPEGEVHLSEDVGPGVFGVLRTGVVLPRWCLELGGLDRSLILAHEEEHRRSRDTLLVALGALAVVILPWNPVAWWMWHRLRSAVEVDCDHRVTRTRPRDRRRYGRLLLLVGARRGGLPMPLATFSDHPRTLSRRIHMLTRPSHRLDLPRGLLLAVLGIAVIAVACIIPGPDRMDGLVDPLDESETEVEVEASDLAAVPQFTPHDEPPRMRDQALLARALERAYPAIYRDNGIGGTVMLHVFVDEEGTVRNVEIAESSGHQGLDEAALSVTDGMAFEAARNRGEAVPVWVQVPITFQSRDGHVATTPADREERRARAQAPADTDSEDAPHFTPHDQPPRILDEAVVASAVRRSHPEVYRDNGIGGTVMLHVFIDEEGMVRDARVAESSGHQGLDEAALGVTDAMTFEPARNRGEAVPVWVQVPITFGAGEGDATPPAADPAERRTSAQAVDDSEDGPRYTPHDQPPRIRNASEVSRLLSEAYPSELREAGIGGTVLLHTFIDESGVVLDAQVAEGSGHEGLDEAALDVAQTFEYEPALNRGDAVPVWVQVPVTFTAN